MRWLTMSLCCSLSAQSVWHASIPPWLQSFTRVMRGSPGQSQNKTGYCKSVPMCCQHESFLPKIAVPLNRIKEHVSLIVNRH